MCLILSGCWVCIYSVWVMMISQESKETRNRTKKTVDFSFLFFILCINSIIECCLFLVRWENALSEHISKPFEANEYAWKWMCENCCTVILHLIHRLIQLRLRCNRFSIAINRMNEFVPIHWSIVDVKNSKLTTTRCTNHVHMSACVKWILLPLENVSIYVWVLWQLIQLY